jgi:DNA segregation ATPase FtsK/SpoIIIE-like protein
MGRLRLKRVAAPPPGTSGAPDLFNFVRDVVEPLAAGPHRNALAFVGRDGVIEHRSFGEVGADAARWAALLRDRGLEPGDHVLVLVGRSPAWPAVMLGTLKAGLVAVPCPETLPAPDLELWAARCGARLTVADRAHVPTFAALGVVPEIVVEDVVDELRGLSTAEPAHDTVSSDLAIVLFESTTDRELKAVSYTHGYTRALRAYAEQWLEAREDDRVWCTAAAGSSESIRDALFGPWSVGAETVVHDGDFDPNHRLELIGRLGVTILCQTPEEFRVLAAAAWAGGAELGRLRRAVSEGPGLDSRIVRISREALGLTVSDGYGRKDHDLAAHTDTIRIALGTEAEETPPPGSVTAEEANRLRELEWAVAVARAREDERRREEQERIAATRATDEERLAEQERAEQERAAPEAQARDDERRRAEAEQAAAAARAREDERRREEQERTAAATQAAVDERRRKEQEKAAAAQAKEDERRRKEQEKAAAAEAKDGERRRKEQEQAAAAQAKADERQRHEQEKAAAAQAKADERQRQEQEKAAAAQAKADERQRQEQEKAAAAEARRAADAQRAAEREAARRAEQQRRAADAARRKAEKEERKRAVPAPVGRGDRIPDAGDDWDGSSLLVERLSAYGRSATSEPPQTPAE